MTKKRRLGTAACAAAVLGIGWLDYVSGPEIGLSLLYLIPIAFCGWFGGVLPALVVASAAGFAWLAADLAWRTSDVAIAISVWNAFTRFVIYLSEGVLLAVLRRDREKLHKLVASESALARTDNATQLPNARAFIELIELELARARETGDSVCAVYVDLDNFKRINDGYGHATGDEVLQRVADVLQHSIRGHDVAARLGGDEFAVLLRGVEPDVARNVGERIARRIREVGAAYATAALGATIGVAHFRSVPATATDLLRAADHAMYAGKTSGKGTVVLQNL